MSRMGDVERFTVGRYTVTIEYDDSPESPRECDNLGTMVCWHRRYNLGDKHTFDSPESFRASDDYKHAAVILPLYLYDHSGITMSVAPFNDVWDSGQVGYVYVTRAKVHDEYGKVNAESLALAEEVLRAEVHAYDQFITGQVYAYTIEQDGQHVDSCCGFYGLDYVRDEARRTAEYWNAEAAKVDKLQLDWL